MSDQEQEQIEDEEEENEQQEGDEDQEGDQQDEDQDGDQDQDQQGDEDDQDGDEQDEDQQGQQQDQQKESQSQQKPVPTFKPVSQEFAFKNLLSDIASLGSSVDHFISSLPSRGGSGYRSYQPRIEYQPYRPRIVDPLPPAQQKKYTIMKDQDVQVSMQPQIVIQQTLTPKQQPKKQPYRISNQSTKFLAQLYQENKKLKRWQNTQTGSMSGWNKSKDKFQRPEHQRGLINLQDRNKQIDEAIEMLRREDSNL